MQKARTSKTKIASKTINMTSSPQPPIQTVGDNMSVANQPATSNMSVSQDKGSNTSNIPTLAALVIPYTNDQPADPDLWDNIFALTLLLEIDKF